MIWRAVKVGELCIIEIKVATIPLFTELVEYKYYSLLNTQ